MRPCAPLLAVVLCALCVAASADQIVVDQGGAGDFTTIKDAFQAASDGDTITINPGTYKGDSNRNIVWGERNLFLQPGMPRRFPVIDLEGAHRFVSLTSGYTDTTSIITGLNIINGTAPDVPSGGGGAIYAYYASPRIIMCNFSGCNGQFGGAVKFLYSNGKVLYCNFTGNTADQGGALSASYGGDVVVEGCTFVENTAASGGGAMRFYDAVRAVRGCTLVRNGAPVGGGLALYVDSNPAIERCIIAFSTEGGAVYADSPPDTVFQCISYGNVGGDGLSRSRQEVLYVDPRFCGFYSDDFTLCENSPALPDNNVWGVQVGRYGQGCPPCDSPVADSTWGRIKSLYR